MRARAPAGRPARPPAASPAVTWAERSPKRRLVRDLRLRSGTPGVLRAVTTRRRPDRSAPGRPGRVSGRPAVRAAAGGRMTSARALKVIEMARPPVTFACPSCGHESPKWMGRCTGCGEWNTLVEEQAAPPEPSGVRRSGRIAAARKAVPLAEVEPLAVARVATGSGELDRVLGGGIVPGSIVLIGGSPGIGKSTLMSAALGSVQASGKRAMYVSGEESAAQIRLRAERLGANALT